MTIHTSTRNICGSFMIPVLARGNINHREEIREDSNQEGPRVLQLTCMYVFTHTRSVECSGRFTANAVDMTRNTAVHSAFHYKRHTVDQSSQYTTRDFRLFSVRNVRVRFAPFQGTWCVQFSLKNRTFCRLVPVRE